MRYLPVNLDVLNRPAVVVGGGEVASRKVLRLLEAGARVTVIAPALTARLQREVDSGRLTHLARPYMDGDLSGALLAISATSDSAINGAVAAEASARAIIADIVDAPETGSFTMPAIINRGDLVITVSTGGKSPALARKIRRELEAKFGEEFGTLVGLLGAIREKLLTEKGNSAYNKSLLSELVANDLPRLILEKKYDELDQLLLEIFGPGYSMRDLWNGEKDHQ